MRMRDGQGWSVVWADRIDKTRYIDGRCPSRPLAVTHVEPRARNYSVVKSENGGGVLVWRSS
jgi:hypothetical protein